MGSLNCFCTSWRKKKDKGENCSITTTDKADNVKTLQVKVEHVQKSSETTESRSKSFIVPVPFDLPQGSTCQIKVMNHYSPVAAEVDYEGGDEHDESLSMKRDNSDFDLQAKVENLNEEKYQINESLDLIDNRLDNDNMELISTGHVSDPGREKAEFWASPNLKRSCSNMDMRNMSQNHGDQMPFSKSKSYEDMQNLAHVGDDLSPVLSHRSADKVMLKKHSSSQILPSGSRRLWWKLFLWSHRNLHRASSTKRLPIETSPFAHNQQGGYSSDTLEQSMESRSLKSPGSWAGEESRDKGTFYGVSGMWPQNQWIAFPRESTSPLARVDEWVNEVTAQAPYEDDGIEDGIFFPASPDNAMSPARGSSHLMTRRSMATEEISHANSVVQSLNASSTVAHITGIGLKVLPSISHFVSLRSVNLSNNFIAHISPGSLPKGLHVLDLSRNKISTIEGLRELTRLRVLDLSYNRITRIGQGLSNCTLIKELYLAGNKVSSIEGLHRLLKLTVLDLSFNKITTTKALGQLVANYNSLVALNLLGNPIQSNISDEQLRKTICSLLPKVAFLNKQAVNSQKAREVHTKAIAKAALGSDSRSLSRRKGVKRVSNGRSTSAGPTEKSRQRSRSRSRLHLAVKEKA
ncbi:hypothetical protein ACJIZ3_019215 [Penstemon smallii]|uniref:Uncharacterized protein n=1 Tax=Penstemon smallii TaxID=265156 RepID=A0ABD3T1S4_9LAMI